MPEGVAWREDHTHRAVAKYVVVTIDDLVRPLFQGSVVLQRIAELFGLRSEHGLEFSPLGDPSCIFEQIDISDMIKMRVGKQDRADVAGPHPDFVQLVRDGATHDAAYAMRDNASFRMLR